MHQPENSRQNVIGKYFEKRFARWRDVLERMGKCISTLQETRQEPVALPRQDASRDPVLRDPTLQDPIFTDSEKRMTTQLEQEIASQPETIAHLLASEVQHIKEIVSSLPPFQYILIAARGSSDNAGVYAQYAWSTMAGYQVAMATPSVQTLYHTSPRMQGALVVGISQSGQSPDIVAVLEEAKRQGCSTIAITNDGASPLANIADHVVELHVGQEKSVAATKTYTAQLAVVAIFAAAWSRAERHMTDLHQLPDLLADTLKGSTQIQQRAERYRFMEYCSVIGRGYNYATAFELALKLKELNYIITTPYSSADFRHGPIATIGEGAPVALIMPSGAVLDDMLDLARTLKERRAELLIISDNRQALELATTPLPLVRATSEWLSPISAIIPGQLLAMYNSMSRGYHVDTPRGLNKVTLTK
jgi:glutamine---fructose-6-phosphate transaminase (isomerizing)